MVLNIEQPHVTSRTKPRPYPLFLAKHYQIAQFHTNLTIQEKKDQQQGTIP